ncbi:MAG TPA: hypothetical protein VGV38_23880, partial [Pyrinomonadaceae bacterium]|nr:hypothetical protein [Pyrinomonadaceae bacterium]
AWVILSWLDGLRRLGFRVHFVEQVNAETCVDGIGARATFAESVNLEYFRRVFAQFKLLDAATLVRDEGAETFGLAYAELRDLLAGADLLVNITGHLAAEPLKRAPRLRAYVDLDPGFTQFWHAQGRAPWARLGGHEFYFTVGENVGTPLCNIPTGGVEWRRVRQPCVLGEWTPEPPPAELRFTTVASWRGAYAPVEHDGRTYGLKAHEWRKFFALPRLAGREFEIALDIHPAEERDLRALAENNWRVVSPRERAADPDSFRRYVQGSSAEFSAAQQIYVETGSGWFSDRTVRYLASARPALVQDTGFGEHLPAGEGLLSFRTLDEAVEGANRIARDYDRHARAARRLAEEYFDSDKVLCQFVEEIGVAP